MLATRTTGLVLAAAVLVTAAATSLVARPLADGITYEFRMTVTTIDGGRSKETMNMKGLGRIAGTMGASISRAAATWCRWRARAATC